MTTTNGWPRRVWEGVALVTTAGVLAVGCTGGGDGGGGPATPVVGAVARLVSFDSCDDLLGWFHEEAGERVTAYGLEEGWYGVPGPTMRPFMAEDSAASESSRAAADGAEASTPTTVGDFSTTNVQEAGVGEPDLAVTDGSRLVTVVGGDLRVVDLTGPEPVVAATVELGEPGGRLLVEGDHAVVISHGWSDRMPVEPDGGIGSSSMLPPGSGRTTLTRIDLDGEPRVVGRVEIGADHVDARMVDGVVRVVTRSGPEDLGFVYPSGTEASEQRSMEANRDIIASSTIEDWLPELAVANADGTEEVRQAVACDAVDHPEQFSGFDVVTVVGLDLRADGAELVPSAGVVAGAGTVYASTDTLYVTTERWPDAAVDGDTPTSDEDGAEDAVGTAVPGPTRPPTPAPELGDPATENEPAAPETTVPDTTTAPTTTPGTSPSSAPTTSTTSTTESTTTSTSTSTTEPSTTTTSEPEATTTTTTPDDPVEAGPHTDVHAFGIAGRGPAEYLASGRVRGTVLDQFSLSEHEGHLRVATTVDPGWWGWSRPMTTVDGGRRVAPEPEVSESFVTVLERDGETLARIGEVGGLGRTEQIYSARFVGDLAYVVTFRRTDPLYVVDLRDPAAPVVAGELKINGYSSYLQLVDEGRLLGVGQDGTDDGRLIGFAESLFDVSDPANPTRLAQFTVADGTSLAEQDHHALLWWPATDTLVVPLEVWGAGPIVPLPAPEPGADIARAPADVFRGVLVTTVTDDGIVERGRLAHPSATEEQPPGGTRPVCPPEADCGPGFYEPAGYAPTIERSLVVGDRLLTVSTAGVMVNDLATLEARAWTAFA
ncbi:beta-propeller domain-containing protein [Rhabdothermincola salaria]|uniref:beta-propeller domain-containing protein n=1 Tax=Rhabdothermincola salaria TaxID=2903142 RepID=UPI001E572224|nr:beta-propeller domain-containing protein [Rhabdothermincola salaria]MCD9623693.1 beta-propeller domain-containing protein [Rhabdothermincola salaria]